MNYLQEELQSLIDGQLDCSERVVLLQTLEQEHPEHWRSLALGFVEAQLLQQAFQDLPQSIPQTKPPKKHLPSVFGVAAALMLSLIHI